MDNNKVNVKIYGQEYIIAGDAPKEEIMRVAAHVDMKMNEIAEGAKAVGATTNNVAILAAINITSEYFKHLEDLEDLKKLNIRLEKDAQHYVQLWDESKKNFEDYKSETQNTALKNEQLTKELAEKDAEIARLTNAAKENSVELQKSANQAIQEAENKCKELENSFFDLQMENLQLKKELDKYKDSIGRL